MNNTTKKHPIDNLYALLIWDKEREKIKAGEIIPPDEIKKTLYIQFYLNNYNKRIYEFYETLANDILLLQFYTEKPRSNELIEALLYMFGYTPFDLADRRHEAIHDAELKIAKINNNIWIND